MDELSRITAAQLATYKERYRPCVTERDRRNLIELGWTPPGEEGGGFFGRMAARLGKEARVLRAQRQGLEAQVECLMSALTRIHSFLSPEDVRTPDGTVYRFDNPAIEREMLRGLSEAIRSVPDTLAKAAGWQPIETAPKDGTAVLGWDKDEGSDVMHFREGLWMQRVDDACWVRTPTHWRPLPPPPEV
jgi:hypothetical protein